MAFSFAIGSMKGKLSGKGTPLRIADHLMLLSYIRRNFKTVKALKAAGIEDISFSHPHKLSRSKYIVADKKEVALGTGNWLDEDVEIHPQLYIRLSDAKLGRALLKHLKEQMTHRSAERLWSKPRGTLNV